MVASARGHRKSRAVGGVLYIRTSFLFVLCEKAVLRVCRESNQHQENHWHPQILNYRNSEEIFPHTTVIPTEEQDEQRWITETKISGQQLTFSQQVTDKQQLELSSASSCSELVHKSCCPSFLKKIFLARSTTRVAHKKQPSYNKAFRITQLYQKWTWLLKSKLCKRQLFFYVLSFYGIVCKAVTECAIYEGTLLPR